MTNFLILSHGFNMDGRASSQTVTDKLSYFVDAGYQPYILSSITGKKDSLFPHAQLIAWGPSAFRFDFRHWFSLRFGKGWCYKLAVFGVSLVLLPFIFFEKILIGLSSQWSWALPAFVRALFLVKKNQINLIYSSGGAWSAHFAAWLIHKTTGIKWVAEIHDPLVVRAKNDDSVIRRCSRDEIFQKWLEKKICESASLVWWFTKGALYWAKYRNPRLGDRGFYVFPGAKPPTFKLHYSRGPQFSVGHFGSLSDTRSLAPFLEVLPDFFDGYPNAKNYFRLDVYGGALDKNSQQLIEELNLASHVFTRGRVEFDSNLKISGRDQIFKLMASSDFLLLMHGSYEGCSEYIPSKLYDYWWAGRPIIAITHINAQLNELVRKINNTDIFTADSIDRLQILNALTNAWIHWENRNQYIQVHKPLDPSTAVNEIVTRLNLL